MSWTDRPLWKISGLIPLALTAGFLLLTLWNPPWIEESAEALLLDYRFKLRNVISPPEIPEDIVIVAIDEASLSRFGRWPWSRSLQAELINRIAKEKPKAIGVDIFYSEPETSATDQALANALNNSDIAIVTALAFEVEQNKTSPSMDNDALFDHALMRVENQSLLKPIRAHRVLLPAAPLDEVTHFAHVYMLPDRNGKIRQEALYLRYADDYLPSLPLLTIALALKIPFDEIAIEGGHGVRLQNLQIATDENGRVPINFYGKEGSFPMLSATDLLENRFDPERLADKIVFVGTTAIATYDQKSTPLSANMSGVEKNATVAANILANSFLRQGSISANMIMVLTSGSAMLMIGLRSSALRSTLGFLAIGAIIIIVNQALFSSQGVILNLFYPLGNTLVGSFSLIAYKYLVEEKSARQLRTMFSSYVTPIVLDELIKNPEVAKLGGQRREVSILFSDIRGFSSFSEKKAPEDVVEMLNEYLEAMTDVVFHWEGTLDKFVGDAVIAFWSAPLPQSDHAERAVRCSLHMLQRLEELQAKWQQEGKESLDIGIGLNTGEVVVGNIGAESKKMDYTVIGNHVNLCARIESLTRRYNNRLMVSEQLLAKIRTVIDTNGFGHMVVKEVDKVTVKGISQPVSVYSIEPGKHAEQLICLNQSDIKQVCT